MPFIPPQTHFSSGKNIQIMKFDFVGYKRRKITTLSSVCVFALLLFAAFPSLLSLLFQGIFAMASVPPGDINTQPNSKIVFNAPYDDKHTYHIKVSLSFIFSPLFLFIFFYFQIINAGGRRIGW